MNSKKQPSILHGIKMSKAINYCCSICKKPLNVTSKCCDYSYTIEDDKISYDHEKMLFNHFRKDFYLNKNLNINGHLSYYILPEGSVSLSERADVQAFSQYINNFYKKGIILDVGCGPLVMPGYLDLIHSKDNKFYGLDPITDIKFFGEKIIGSFEFLPCPDESFDTLIFATTLDHVCNLSKTFNEIRRVLKPGGKAIFWHWSNEMPISNWMRKIKIRFFSKARYYTYPNNISFIIPKGAIDPYHKDYISLKTIMHLGKKNNLKFMDLYSNKDNKLIPLENYFFTLQK
jgi:ubiquinone/menaquinone biosynthesis C-methylase UbiE